MKVHNTFILRRLSYVLKTISGAYYYYHTEDNKTYEDTLLDVSSYARTDNRIPYRYTYI